ncbi:DUF2407 C-terminal domain-containing protein [Delphinella strobiligena]|nr:DUF2407 C-terminal domain-containing protein [Delphinella strobiligena]
MAYSLLGTAVDLVIRFTTSQEDLVVHIDSAQTTTPLSVKQRIRQEASTSVSGSRLRLIFSGRFLPDTAALSKCITIPPPPPPAANDSTNARGKGKARATSPFRPQASRVIINCSVGDALTSAELAAESEAADAADVALIADNAHTSTTTTQTFGANESRRTAPEPRGFDRLLSQGFNTAAVAEMRAQYLQILSYTRTPDTMPSGDELRALEDRWLDNNDASNGRGADGGGAVNGEDGGLEDMLWGNIIGFFWPVAMLLWFREEGMWSRRRQISVLTGMLVNLTFGFLRITS